VRRAARVAIAAALAPALPRLAQACAVCSVLTDARTRKALFNATVFMSLLPLAVIALGLWWFARRAGTAMSAEFHESPDAVADSVTDPRRV
jgi:uncharacterized membrane protein YfbV (UPF0208 family)